MLLAFSKVLAIPPTAVLCHTARVETAALTATLREQTGILLQLLEEIKHDNQESVDRLKSEG